MNHPLPWLRYVSAGDLDDSTFDFDGLDVKNAEGESLGDVNGFILDADSARPYYVVVDSKGLSRICQSPVQRSNSWPAAGALALTLTRVFSVYSPLPLPLLTVTGVVAPVLRTVSKLLQLVVL